MKTEPLDEGAVQQRAFDDRNPPDMDLIEDCVHCGFCLPTCPTYVLWGEEMDSPRGRIVLMRTGLEEGSELTDSMATHFDRCLGCMACVTACPSGVQYDRLIEQTRPQVERHHERSRTERTARRAAFALFTHPKRLRLMVPLLAATRKLKLDRAVARSRLGRRWPQLGALAALAPDVRVRATTKRLGEHFPAVGEPRGRVGLLQGCVQRAFFGDVNEATARVLSQEGYEVVAPAKVRCCGALMLHTGYEDDARKLAHKAIAEFEDCDFIITNAAGCGSAIKDYVHLLADDPQWSERAAALSAKARDVMEFLGSVEPRGERHRIDLTVAYHDACHLAHAQGVRAEPRALLKGIPGLELVEPAEWEICCGSAGIYNLLQPEAATELGERKADNLLATGAQAIAAGNPGCTLQIGSRLRDRDKELPVYHPIQLLDASLSGGGALDGK
ncbi:MAG: (Fe-S)-binding protein [Actinomycetota bacterium]